MGIKEKLNQISPTIFGTITQMQFCYKKKIPRSPRPQGIILSIVGFNLVQTYSGDFVQ